MAKRIAPLTISQIKNAKTKDKLVKLSDGGGLALWVYASGLKSWKLSFRDDAGKQQTLTLGRFPDFSLVEAREWREDVRRRRSHGEAVIESKVRADFCFETVARAWYAKWSPEMSEKYAAQVLRLFERWIFPGLGKRDIREIKTVDVVAVLDVMERRGIADTLRKTKNSIGMVFGFAVARGMIDFNPVLQIGKGAFTAPKNTNMAALAPDELPRLIDFLEQRGEFANPSNRLKISATTRLVIYWLLLSMTRVQETCLAEWAEIDRDEGVWLIPAERKKERRAHVVPLSAALQWALEQAEAINVNGQYLFESYNFQSHACKESPRMAMQRAGLDTTAHGLRSLARTYLREKLHVADDVAEKLLAHSLGTKTQAAYNRAELLDERREALERWGDVVLSLVKA